MAVFNKVVVLEAQDDDIPEDVKEEIRVLWQGLEFGNDYYYYHWDEQDFHDVDKHGPDNQFTYPLIAKYLRDNGIEECLIHYWW